LIRILELKNIIFKIFFKHHISQLILVDSADFIFVFVENRFKIFFFSKQVFFSYACKKVYDDFFELNLLVVLRELLNWVMLFPGFIN
jgi:hypothetical protein